MKEISDKQRRTREKYAKKKVTNEKIFGIVFAIVAVLSLFVLKNKVTKAAIDVNQERFSYIPVQNNVVETRPYFTRINGTDVVITKLADYEIAGRVVGTYDYTSSLANVVKAISGKEYYNEISHKDVAISYGPMALSENHKKMKYSMPGSRKVVYTIKDSSINEIVGNIDTIGHYITNNHLIALDSKVENLIKKIEKDDYVQIKGSLVRVSWEKGIYEYAIESSLSREDTGNGACEVILVEDVKWLNGYSYKSHMQEFLQQGLN